MNKSSKYLISFVFLFFGGCNQSMNVFEKDDVKVYLNEAKECFITQNKKSDIPKYLGEYIKLLDDDDYISHVHLESGELLVHFKKAIKDSSFSIELVVDLNKEKRCERLSVYEISSE